MSKIEYIYPNDGLTVKAVHAYYQEALFFELLFPILEQQTRLEDSLIEELQGLTESWVKQELCLLGFVSTYHLWERQLQELFLEQKKLFNIDIPSLRSKENMVDYAKRILLNIFDVSVSTETWNELDKARIIVNAFKHGPSQKFDAAMRTYPEYFFTPDDGRHLPIVSVSVEQLRSIINIVVNFWDKLPRKINYS